MTTNTTEPEGFATLAEFEDLVRQTVRRTWMSGMLRHPNSADYRSSWNLFYYYAGLAIGRRWTDDQLARSPEIREIVQALTQASSDEAEKIGIEQGIVSADKPWL